MSYKKRLLIFSSIFIATFSFCIAVNAQTVESIKADSQNYIYGEGSGVTIKSADQIALDEIIGQISIQVESNYERSITETNENFSEVVNNVIKTYSNATLTCTERIILQNEPDAKVFRYVKRSEIAKIFEGRKNKIIEWAKNGENALNDLKIADALRYFYWSQTLLRSHPQSAEIILGFGADSSALLVSWLPMKINQVFSDLSIMINTIEDKGTYSNYLLDVKYKGQAVRNFDFSYWSGQNWSNIVSSNNGIYSMELPKLENDESINLKVEYAFDGETTFDLELRDVMQKLPLVPYKNCYFNVLKKPEHKTQVNTQMQKAVPVNEMGRIQTLSNSRTQDKTMRKLVASISNNEFVDIEQLFTEQGYSIFKKLLQYGNAKIVKSFDLAYYTFGDYVICRSIPMSFNFKTNNRVIIEDVVFYFDKENKICNITFSLTPQAIADIASNNTWSEENRLLLISFLENYQTAYALKRLDYIERIFSEDALIITGFVTKTINTAESRYSNNKIVKYNRYSKEEYLKKLSYSFGSNEFINIRFADNTVRQSGKGDSVYGIQIKQEYFSSNYGDSGYLFLLVDLNDQQTPQIHVRTWQPDKNPDGSIYGLADF